MEKSVITLIWLSSAILSLASSSMIQSPKAVEKWVETLTLAHKQEKLTKLHFYFHRLGGTTPSGVVVAKANTTNPTPTSFGLTVIRDDPLTVGPEISSSHVGYAQGMSAVGSMEEVILIDYFALSFTDGSTLAVLGSNAILHNYRELPIVGGTGVFRLARGIITLQTYSYNATSGEACVEADAVVFHF